MNEPASRTDAMRTGEVRHMKWWGWGVEGVGFHHEDKPGFAPFVHKAVGLDLRAGRRTREPDFSQLAVPASAAPEEFVGALTGIVGQGNAVVDDLARVVHTYGKSLRDLVRLRAGEIARCPDVVVFPADEEEVRSVVDAAVEADAVIIPFGGGSNIAGSLEPHPDESRVVVSLDLGRLSRVLEIDTDSGLARVQAGVLGPALEAQLNGRGWTMGHFPDSFTHSSLGGWIATRSSGMQSDKYGDIADIVKGLRVVRAGGVLVIRAVPSASTGPSVREMVVGSEGRLGVVTEATVRVHRLPESRGIHAYFFKNFDHGLAAMQEIAASDVSPSVTRISDAHETGFSLATSKESKGVAKKAQAGLMAYLRRRGWDLDEICLSFIGFEGGTAHAKRQKSVVDRIVRRHHGIGVGKGPGALYDQKKFDTPYIRDFLLDHGAAGDVSETAGPWSKLRGIHAAVYEAADSAYEEIGRTGWTMCHMSHSYHSGACLYFTFAFVFGDDPLGEYDTVKRAIQQAFIDAGGTISHHHGVGLEHAPWLEEDISAQGVAVMSGLFEAVDPGGNFNPRKIVV
ncbi:FAD-binding oxidoreductase [Streptomyces sp. PA03-3a]|nr:FAD-binding oxidoreductase [Streptomyces sp. PA03-3a]